MARFRLDDTLALATQGYGWLPNRLRRAGADAYATRLLGLPVVALHGPEAARFFYDEGHVRRHGAVPEPVRSTLFGHRAVHTLDGAAHRVRKALFTGLLMDGGIDDLVGRVESGWDAAAKRWTGGGPVVLFDAVAEVLTRAVCGWTGLRPPDAQTPALAADLVALVDGFGSLGPRNLRARRARTHRENEFAALFERVRRGETDVPEDSAVVAVARHRDADGNALDSCLAAVELLNILRPTVAVSWFVAFAGHALHRWPAHRERLAGGDPAFAEAYAHEVRRFYPFAPFVGGRAVRDLAFDGVRIPAGGTVLLDLYGQNHDPRLWPEPYRFTPERFVGRQIGEFELVPQGGGDPRTGHRCPGETITVALLRALVVRLARLAYRLPEQDLTIPLHRLPTRPRSGVLMEVTG
ncbi:cytochrome P450 [Micromonospora sp. NPDC050686]|uniref:cytochrome P450 n=1 Tax=Micromonospora sp. NPDC050686 TaxID=3154631 RepID=UPI0033ED4AE7